MPTLRKIARAWLKAHPDTQIEEVSDLAAQLWDSVWHEERILAVLLLEYRCDDLTLAQMPLIENMLHGVTGWAQLDPIAIGLVGALIDTDPATLDYLVRWAASEDFWVRRAAILAQIAQFRQGRGDLNLFATLVVPMLSEGPHWTKDERFFIRKAIGWALRELCRSRPDWVFAFVQQHQKQMSGLTYHEATRNLPETFKQRLNR